jgi:uncharacterized protein
MNRRDFIQKTALASSVAILPNDSLFGTTSFPAVRIAASQRKFSSPSVEGIITELKQKIKNQEMAWLFENCFPNTLDTTVEFETIDNRPDTYVITGDIDAMWLRDSTAQVTPYLSLVKNDPQLQKLISGVINRQVKNILKDPYANAFYKDTTKVSEWKDDLTEMQPGIHERKWEIDSLCYPIRLGYLYWKQTNDPTPFDSQWVEAIALTVKTFKEQQRKTLKGPYKFERRTSWATDGVPLGGYGYPAKANGMIFSMFRPSDDATIYPLFVPANLFAVVSLKQAAEMLTSIHKNQNLANECNQLADEVRRATLRDGLVNHPKFGKILAYEINGLGSSNLMDDANVPSLLSLPYLGAMSSQDPIYQNTRQFVLSENNPFYFKGKAGEGIGGPHVGVDMIWHLSVIMRGLTSGSDSEIKYCLKLLQNSHADTGFMHEAFHKDDPKQFTRKWFAWANTLFGEFVLKVYRERKHLLDA